MTKEEKREVVFYAIDAFLAKPQTCFSQMAVLDSLSALGVPEGELISFMVQRMRIGDSPKEVDSHIQPFVFMSSVLILALGALRKISVPEPGQAFHTGISCSGCHSKHIVGWRYKCGHCPNSDFCEKCVAKHVTEYPDHVMVIIQEPLPYNSQTIIKAANLQQPILPPFEFKDGHADPTIIFEEVSCENCGKKPVTGRLFKCANCEDYTLCEKCYSDGTFEHFSFHVFLQLLRPLKNQDKSPTILLQVLDARLYPKGGNQHVNG